MCGAELRATLKYRLNTANAKTEMSYPRCNGTPVFMLRSCNKCLHWGQDNQLHFDFDCHEDPAMMAFVVNYMNDIYGACCYDMDTYHEIDHRLHSEAERVYDSEEESGNDMGFEQM
jgi:hypothetical protein